MLKNLSAKLLSTAQRVKVFNSGLEVWLYDSAAREPLKASGAFEVATSPEVFEQAMRGFVADGRLLCYSLMQDDSIDVAVAVRKPLTAGERRGVPWRELQQGYLELPTGRLVIESNDALTLRKLEPTDPGAEIEVPPGNYLVTLHRVDWDVLAEEEAEWEGPAEFITLTSGPKAKPVRRQPPVLPWEAPQPADAAWSVSDEGYAGAVIFDDDLMAMRLAIGAAGVAQLGLTDRSATLVHVPALDFECVIVWVSGDRRQGAYYDRLERLHPPLACRGKEWALCNLEGEVDGDETLFCLRRDPTAKIARKHRGVWHPATMRVLDSRALERK